MRDVIQQDSESAFFKGCVARAASYSPLVDQFRQSVLARAFTGELTADWRAEHPDVEPASELLERIKVERKKKWIDNYARNLADRARKRAEKKGKPFTEDDWQAYYDKKVPQGEDRYEQPDPVDPEKEGLPEIPETWEWVTVDALAATVEYGISKKMDPDGPGVPILRMPNIDSSTGTLVFDDLKYLPFEHDDFPEMYLEPGDVLFNRTNSAELVGKTAVYHEDDPSPCTFASYLIRVIPLSLKPDLLAWYINSPHGEKWLSDVRSQQVGQANVSGSKLKNLRFPLPPLTEQKAIHGSVRAHLSELQSIERYQSHARQNMEKLRKSVLADNLGSTMN